MSNEQRAIIDEAHLWTDAELREARLRPLTDLPPLPDPALSLPPIRRVWMDRQITWRGDTSDGGPTP